MKHSMETLELEFLYQELHSDSEWTDLRKAFEFFDTNKDGSIDREEVANALRLLGQDPSEQNLNDIMNEVGDKQTQLIDLKGFALLLDLTSRSPLTENLRHVFNMLDKDSDGVLSLQESITAIKQINDKLSDSQIAYLIKQIDSNGDGVISFEEFCEVFQESSYPNQIFNKFC